MFIVCQLPYPFRYHPLNLKQNISSEFPSLVLFLLCEKCILLLCPNFHKAKEEESWADLEMSSIWEDRYWPSEPMASGEWILRGLRAPCCCPCITPWDGRTCFTKANALLSHMGVSFCLFKRHYLSVPDEFLQFYVTPASGMITTS